MILASFLVPLSVLISQQSGPRDPGPYVLLDERTTRVVVAAGPGTEALAAGSGGPICGAVAIGRHGEAVPGGGTLNPFAGGNPAPLGGSFAGARGAFFAQVSGSARNQGIFEHDGTALVPIAVGCGGLGGSGVPGGGCGDPTPVGGTFGGFFSGTPFAPAVNDAGDALFLAEVEGGSAPRALFLYQRDTATIVKIAAVGDPAPRGGSFAIVGPGALNDARQVAFLASTSGAGPSDVFLWQAGVVSAVAQAGDPAPGGGTYLFLGSESLGFVDGTTIPSGPVPDLNDQGILVFRAVVLGGSVERGFVRTELGQNPAWIVAAGQPTGSGGTFLDFGAATVNESGEYAFFADFKPTSTTFSAGWFAGTSGDWRRGLAFFDPVGSGVCFGLAFSRNPMTPLDDQGNLVLWTDVQGPGTTMREHLVVRQRDGTLAIVARRGDATPFGGTYGSLDAWPSLDAHGRGTLGAFVQGAPGIASAHVLFEACPGASASARNGSGLNDPCFASAPPRLGATWTAVVDLRSHPHAFVSAVFGHARPLSGRPLGASELLVDTLSPRFFASLVPASGAAGVHAHAIPNLTALAGVRAYFQAAILGGGSELCNAVDVVLGF